MSDPNAAPLLNAQSSRGRSRGSFCNGLYFTINRARQYGKTTTLALLEKRLKEQYLVVDTGFEGIDDEAFESNKQFSRAFQRTFAKGLKAAKASPPLLALWTEKSLDSMDDLNDLIDELCSKSERGTVLMIDEVDKTSNNQVFLNFLGLLRNKYLQRNKGVEHTFHSVILAGVSDIKNLKLKIHGESQTGKNFNSPWNIAADFKVDMSFSPENISTMLVDYENDHHTGMDIHAISNELYQYTNGYPFLVSKLCKTIDEDLDMDWTIDGLKQAVKVSLKDSNTLFDDMFKNIENNQKLYDLIFDVMLNGAYILFSTDDPTIGLGALYGILSDKNGKVSVANTVFEMRIANYLAAKTAQQSAFRSFTNRSEVVIGDRFDMPLINGHG